MFYKVSCSFILMALIFGCKGVDPQLGKTEITRWAHDKKGAVSLTYDDGSRKQFSEALPIMKRLGLPATFFIITGPIEGSRYPSRFIGRPVKEIIAESAQQVTDEHNFFERASASRYLGYTGSLPYYDRADAAYESNNKPMAYRIMDSLYQQVRSGSLSAGWDTSMEIGQEKGLNWDWIKKEAAGGYEFASHTVTHAHLAILDTVNMAYELEKSKADIMEHMGDHYAFSAEVPFGIEDPRVMKVALPVYSALRNRMPEPFLTEIDRGNKTQPGTGDKEYVQWQRGPLTATPFPLMKSWIDTTLMHDNIWLVLVFHGIDDVGWQPLSHELLDKYFQYLKDKDDGLWIATFGDVTKYMRERMHAKIRSNTSQEGIIVSLDTSLDTAVYKLPLTLKTYVPADWVNVQVEQGAVSQAVPSEKDDRGSYVLYQASPNAQPIQLKKRK